jgi:hypothetical protein
VHPGQPSMAGRESGALGLRALGIDSLFKLVIKSPFKKANDLVFLKSIMEARLLWLRLRGIDEDKKFVCDN